MDNDKKLFKSHLNKLEEVVINNNNILSSLMQYQILLESNLQELIKLKQKKTIAINGSSKIDFIHINEIIYCNASLSYTEIITINNNKIMSTKSINEFAEQLADHPFFRISKSQLVNAKHIHSYNKKSGQILMQNKEFLDVARRRKTEFLAAILPY